MRGKGGIEHCTGVERTATLIRTRRGMELSKWLPKPEQGQTRTLHIPNGRSANAIEQEGKNERNA